MNVKTEWRGMRELERTLRKLSDRTAKTIMRKAVSAGTTPIVKAVKRRAPVESGALKRSIGRRMKTYRKGYVIAFVGPRSGFSREHRGRARRPANYAALVERGTSKASARPFMRPGYTASKGEAVRRFETKLRTELDKEIPRIRAKALKAAT